MFEDASSLNRSLNFESFDKWRKDQDILIGDSNSFFHWWFLTGSEGLGTLKQNIVLKQDAVSFDMLLYVQKES